MESTYTWQSIKELTRAVSKQEQVLLRRRYCAGRVLNWGRKEKAAAALIYQYLRKMSNERLTGSSESIESGTFWRKAQ